MHSLQEYYEFPKHHVDKAEKIAEEVPDVNVTNEKSGSVRQPRIPRWGDRSQHQEWHRQNCLETAPQQIRIEGHEAPAIHHRHHHHDGRAVVADEQRMIQQEIAE